MPQDRHKDTFPEHPLLLAKLAYRFQKLDKACCSIWRQLKLSWLPTSSSPTAYPSDIQPFLGSWSELRMMFTDDISSFLLASLDRIDARLSSPLQPKLYGSQILLVRCPLVRQAVSTRQQTPSPRQWTPLPAESLSAWDRRTIHRSDSPTTR